MIKFKYAEWKQFVTIKSPPIYGGNTKKAYMERLLSQNYVNKETISHFLR